MTPELIAAIIGLVTAVTLLVRVWTEIAKIKRDRLSTKAARDSEAQALRDQILKNTWEIGNLKSQAKHHDELVEDLRSQVSAVNKELAKALVKLDDISNDIKELKKNA